MKLEGEDRPPRKRGGNPPHVGASPPTQMQREERVHEFTLLLLRGATRSDLHAYARKRWAGQPGTSVRSVDAYIARAKDVIRADWNETREQFTAEMLGKVNQLAKDARKQNNLSVVLGCYNAMARMVGLGHPGPVAGE